jgi:hypothetical protein
MAYFAWKQVRLGFPSLASRLVEVWRRWCTWQHPGSRVEMKLKTDESLVLFSFISCRISFSFSSSSWTFLISASSVGSISIAVAVSCTIARCNTACYGKLNQVT